MNNVFLTYFPDAEVTVCALNENTPVITLDHLRQRPENNRRVALYNTPYLYLATLVLQNHDVVVFKAPTYQTVNDSDTIELLHASIEVNETWVKLTRRCHTARGLRADEAFLAFLEVYYHNRAATAVHH